MKSKEEIQLLIKTIGQLLVLIEDFSELSKKKPDDPVNKFKLNLVNTVLEIINSIIDEQNKPFVDFTLFSDANLPTNSDILVILKQYLSCLKIFVHENSMPYEIRTYWIINNKRSEVQVSIKTLFKEEK